MSTSKSFKEFDEQSIDSSTAREKNKSTAKSFSDKVLFFHEEDISDALLQEMRENTDLPVAIDVEASGLVFNRDYLCQAQIAFGSKYIIVKFEYSWNIQKNEAKYKNFCAMLKDKKILKIFHFGRFDIGMMYTYFRVLCENVFCTKIASKLFRTYTGHHGLVSVVRDMLKKTMSKDRDQQCCDWANPIVTEAQIEYAISDVKYLAELKHAFDLRLTREGSERMRLAQACFNFLPYRAQADTMGWAEGKDESDRIFAHSSKF